MKYFEHALIEQTFHRYLENPAIQIVSFDIFDTLFFRTCGTPSMVFEIMGAHEEVRAWFDTPSSFAHYRRTTERTLKAGGKEVSLAEIYDALPIPLQQKSRFLEIELQTERDVLVLNPQLERWIDMAHSASKQIILISDMYLSTQEITSIALSQLKNLHKISHIYVSCEQQKSKATGELFLHVMDDLNIKASQLLHIGDNPNADISIAKSFGIATLYYGLESNEKEAMHHEALYLKEVLPHGNHLRTLSLLCNPYDTALERFYFRLGASIFAPIIGEFSHWLLACSHQFGLDKLLFLMREGAIFQHYFQKLYPHIATDRVYASRRSTQFLTLMPDDIGSLKPDTFKGLTLKDLYENFFIPFETSALKAYGDLSYEMLPILRVEGKPLLEHVQEELNANKKRISDAFGAQKKLLCAYLDTLHVNTSSALIDFGGGGSVLKNLHPLLSPKTKPHTSILFYQSVRGYQNLNHQHTLSFLPHNAKTAHALECIARTPDFIEILLNGEYPTTVGYTKSSAQTEHLACNDLSMKTIQNALHAGIESFFSLARDYALPSKTFSREHLALMLSRLIELPTHEEVKFLGALEYDEGRGSSHSYTIIQPEQIAQVKRQGEEVFYKHFLANPSHMKQHCIWPQGVLTTINQNFLLPFYGTNTHPNQKVIDTLLEKLDALKPKKIMIYGAGDLFKELLPFLHVRDIHIEAVIDSRAEIQPFISEDFRVLSLEEALRNKKEAVIVIASGVYGQSIQKKIEDFSKATAKQIVVVTS